MSKKKKKTPMIRVCILKRRRREVKVDPKLSAQWNVPKLGGQWNVPKLGGQWNVLKLGGQWNVLKLGGQWNVPKLGGQWNVPKLGGQWNVKEKNTFSPLSTFPLTNLFKPSIFFL
jgi:hypothetical protein